ncbi:hypothetical protein [Shinella sp. M31]|uniref:hypothetical protein n=1 Tax=Shinella sp. M31 TaxID=3368615 RepID=UPI003BA01155
MTEAFVHTLRLNAAFRAEWLRSIIGKEIDSESVEVSTRTTYKNELTNTSIYPDIRIRGDLASGATFTILVEVKWDAPYSFDQIAKYDRLLAGSLEAHLVFICARSLQWRAARQNAARIQHARFHVFKWEQIFEQLQRASYECAFTEELIGFMRNQGLNPGEPITLEMTAAYLVAKPFMPRLERYANKLMHEFDWGFLPHAYRDPSKLDIRSRWGRLALEFAPAPSWNGAITIGFLYDNSDHKVPFADGSGNSVDLFMRIEAQSSIAGRSAANKAINAKLTGLRETGGVVRYEGDGINRNSHTLVIVQRSLTDLLVGNEDEQLQQMHDQILRWSNALFADGTVAEALAKLGSPAA